MSAIKEIEMEKHRKASDREAESLLDKYLRMTFRFIAYSLVALPPGAHAYDIEAACREQERTAQDNIRHMSAPPRILNHCQEVGQSAGGSYQFMEACIKEESKAKDRLY
jgi:hypothetical protein